MEKSNIAIVDTKILILMSHGMPPDSFFFLIKRKKKRPGQYSRFGFC